MSAADEDGVEAVRKEWVIDTQEMVGGRALTNARGRCLRFADRDARDRSRSCDRVVVGQLSWGAVPLLEAIYPRLLLKLQVAS